MTVAGLPPNYREVRHWKLAGNAWLYLALNGLAAAALVVFGAFFLWFGARFGRLEATAIEGGWLAGLIGGLVLTLVLHELAHGLVMRIFGARPQYGVLWKSLVAYATAPGHAFTRGQYLAVSLAPLRRLERAGGGGHGGAGRFAAGVAPGDVRLVQRGWRGRRPLDIRHRGAMCAHRLHRGRARRDEDFSAGGQ